MFITFEGPDGSGKTTHIRLLAEYLRQAGYSVLQTREPGGTALGERIRFLVLEQKQIVVDPLAEMLLIAAARAQHVEQVLKPHLHDGGIVLSDRYIDSSLAYQGHALQLGWDRVQQVNEVAISGLWPDLTVLLMLSPEAAYERSISARQYADRIESRGLEYYQGVCAGYALLQQRFPDRVRSIDASQPMAVVQENVRQLVSTYLSRQSD